MTWPPGPDTQPDAHKLPCLIERLSFRSPEKCAETENGFKMTVKDACEIPFPIVCACLNPLKIEQKYKEVKFFKSLSNGSQRNLVYRMLFTAIS